MESAEFPRNSPLSKFWFANQLVDKTEAKVKKQRNY